MQTDPVRDDRRALSALLDRMEVHPAPRAYRSLPADRDDGVGPLDLLAWGRFCLLAGLRGGFEADPGKTRRRWAMALEESDPEQYADAGPPLTPTAARPGTAAKIAEMARRAEWGEQLHHVGDAPMDGPGEAAVPVISDGNHKTVGREYGKRAA